MEEDSLFQPMAPASTHTHTFAHTHVGTHSYEHKHRTYTHTGKRKAAKSTLVDSRPEFATWNPENARGRQEWNPSRMQAWSNFLSGSLMEQKQLQDLTNWTGWHLRAYTKQGNLLAEWTDSLQNGRKALPATPDRGLIRSRTQKQTQTAHKQALNWAHNSLNW